MSNARRSEGRRPRRHQRITATTIATESAIAQSWLARALRTPATTEESGRIAAELAVIADRRS